MSAGAKAAIFLAITFVISWGALAIGWFHDAHDVSDSARTNLIFMHAPPVAALLCAFLFDKGHRIDALGLAFKPNRWWLAALAFAAMFVAYYGLAALIVPGLDRLEIADSGTVIATFARMFQVPADSLGSGQGSAAMLIALTMLVFSLQNALTEELGWRGYLYAQWRRLGFWRCSLASGLVWSVWHWPYVIMFGQIAGGSIAAGLTVHAISTFAKAPIMTMLRDRSRSVWAPGICHGALNTFGILAAGEYFKSDTSVSWQSALANFVVFLPLMGLLELFRRKWPERLETVEVQQ